MIHPTQWLLIIVINCVSYSLKNIKCKGEIECFCKFYKRQQIYIQKSEETIAGKLWITDTRKFAEKHRSRQFDELVAM
jgi:hypothetical protein